MSQHYERNPASLLLPQTHDHIQGSHHATVTLVEYGDYECSYCRQAYFFVVKQLQNQIGEKLRLVFRNFPLSSLHPHAQDAAEAAEAANTQGKFWPMHDLLYENQQSLGGEDLVRYAKMLGLDADRFTTELRTHVHAAKVQEDFVSGIRAGVNGTPTFFINGVRHDGGHDFDSMFRAIDDYLSQKAA
jgi:protein-disulfide isomerase